MATFEKVVILEDLLTLDQAWISCGYLAGLRDDPEPGSGFGRAYWHGWRNGRVDGGHVVKDEAQLALVHDVLRRATEQDIGKLID